jgi:hypothetical protein
MFTPFAFVKSSVAVDPIVSAWATAAVITNTDVILAVNTFVAQLKSDSIWSKMIAIYPMITDSNTSSVSETQFTWNLVNPSLYQATYLNNNGVGAKGGWTNASGDTFITISPDTIGNNYVYGFYTNSDAATTDVIDMGVYKSSLDIYTYIVGGRSKSGSTAQQVFAASRPIFPYNNSNTGPFTGLLGVGGNSTTGYAYVRTSQLGTASGYDSTQRGDAFKIGLGSFLMDNTTAINPTTKTYQFCFMSSFLNTTEFGNLATAVNTLQGNIDIIFSTSRKAY